MLLTLRLLFLQPTNTMVLLIMLHLRNGSANNKKTLNKILVPSVSYHSPNDGTALIPPLLMVQTHGLTII